MKIFVLGLRGIPHVPGGIEKHCEELFPLIAERGHEVYLCTRKSYVASNLDEWKGVRLINCFAPRQKSFEAIIHTLLALAKARQYSPDLVHIHAVGPSLVTPLARMMGFRVVVTNHGPDYNRQKWGPVAKFVLRLGEKVGGHFANEVIAISSEVRRIIQRRCHREARLIPNGVTFPRRSDETSFLSRIGVQPKRYILSVARLVPEKGLHDLIFAFKASDSDCKLVIAGDADHETHYNKRLRTMAAEDNRVVLAGYLTGEPLNQIYSHASLFVLPSYHEGFPIALLEAMSYGVPVLVSDIPGNREVKLPENRYFPCGDVVKLRDKMESLIKVGGSKDEQLQVRRMIEERYNWDVIAVRTISVYEAALKC